MKNFKKNWFKALAVIVLLLLWFLVSPTTAFFWTIFLVWWAFRLDARIVGGVALAFLVCIPIFLFLHMEERAEQFAVYVYFLLIITVALQIIEYWRDQRYVLSPKLTPPPLHGVVKISPPVTFESPMPMPVLKTRPRRLVVDILPPKSHKPHDSQLH